VHAGSANICAEFVKMACGPEVGLGSFATGSRQQEVRPCPLCPDSDQILQRSEMSQWAKIGSRSRLTDCTTMPQLGRLGQYSVAYLKLFLGRSAHQW
jgi:hypothetical protein